MGLLWRMEVCSSADIPRTNSTLQRQEQLKCVFVVLDADRRLSLDFKTTDDLVHAIFGASSHQCLVDL